MTTSRKLGSNQAIEWVKKAGLDTYLGEIEKKGRRYFLEVFHRKHSHVSQGYYWSIHYYRGIKSGRVMVHITGTRAEDDLEAAKLALESALKELTSPVVATTG